MVDDMKISGIGFSDPAVWRDVVKAIGKLEKLVWNDPLIEDDLTRAEGVRYLTRLIAGALPMTLEDNRADYPQFLQFLSTRIHYGLPATDCYYIWAPVHGDNVYRISGDRGSAHLFDIETRQGHFAHVLDWKLVDRRSDFTLDADNQVEVVLSRKQQPGNWIRLPEGPGNIIFRQYYYDWLTETPAKLRIENINAKYPPPALTTGAVAAQLQLFADWLENLPARFSQVVNTYYQAPANSMVFDSIDFGWKDLQYGKGTYHIAEDEALIVEVKLPKAPYWSIQLCSHFWEARDFQFRQTSLNGHQAQIHSDGVFRAVIAHSDPGIANWLDAGGHQRGLIAIRYYKADSAPVPEIRRVKLSQVREKLPDSPVVTSEQRHESLRARAWSVARRGAE